MTIPLVFRSLLWGIVKHGFSLFTSLARWVPIGFQQPNHTRREAALSRGKYKKVDVLFVAEHQDFHRVAAKVRCYIFPESIECKQDVR